MTAEIGKDIKKARELLEAGRLVAIPTETVYGLAANGLDEKAVIDIFKVKNRPAFDPLILHVPSLEKIMLYTRAISPEARALAHAFWPGPLTLVLERREIVPDLVTAGLTTVGLRCPDHPLTHALLEQLDFPLAAPSANPFGYVSPTTAAHVADQLGERIPYILDGGACRIGLESTIVGFPEGVPTVYRKGGLKISDLEKVVGAVTLRITASSNPRTPGQLASHYAPRKKLIVGNLDALHQRYATDHVAILSFQKRYDTAFQFVLSPSGDVEEAARNLFAALRTLDASPVDVILAEYVPDVGLGMAINDRLRRAERN